MRFTDLWSEFTPNNVPNRALYNLNDPHGVHISEAGASVISEEIKIWDASLSGTTNRYRIGYEL
jgi:hypothetical protein